MFFWVSGFFCHSILSSIMLLYFVYHSHSILNQGVSTYYWSPVNISFKEWFSPEREWGHPSSLKTRKREDLPDPTSGRKGPRRQGLSFKVLLAFCFDRSFYQNFSRISFYYPLKASPSDSLQRTILCTWTCFCVLR